MVLVVYQVIYFTFLFSATPVRYSVSCSEVNHAFLIAIENNIMNINKNIVCRLTDAYCTDIYNMVITSLPCICQSKVGLRLFHGAFMVPFSGDVKCCQECHMPCFISSSKNYAASSYYL